MLAGTAIPIPLDCHRPHQLAFRFPFRLVVAGCFERRTPLTRLTDNKTNNPYYVVLILRSAHSGR